MGDESKDNKEDRENYDPFAARELKHATNDFESMLHILKGILGTGILAMPEAFKHAGIFLGFVCTFMNALLCIYGIHIFVNCIYVLCKRNRINNLTYTNAMRIGFEQGPPWSQKMSRAAGIFTDAIILFYQIGTCCVYVLFVVLNLKAVCDEFMKEHLSVQVYLIIMVLPILLICSLRNLKVLVPVSLVANAIMLLIIGVVFYYIFETPLPKLSERPIFKELKRFPLVFGTTCYAFSSVAVSITVYNNMKNPHHFGGLFGVYNRALIILIFANTSLGFFGFWKFGDDTESSITLNFPRSSSTVQVINVLFAFSIYSSIGLNIYVPVRLLQDTYLSKRLESTKYQTAWEYLLRVLLVSVIIFFAASIPMLGLFMSIFGAISLSHMGFIFPGLLDICVRYPANYGPMKLYIVRDIFMVCYGLTGLLSGCYVGIKEVILEFIKQSKPRH